MSEYEYEEENLDEFMINAAKVLSEENNPEESTIIESLKQHLASISHIKSEMGNFFRTLNAVIFTKKESSKYTRSKIDNKAAFILYPLIFSFNPNITSYYIDYYLKLILKSTCEENREDFPFLSKVFGDAIFFLTKKTIKI